LPSHCTQRYPLPKYPERNNIRKLSDASVWYSESSVSNHHRALFLFPVA
jgi:hypothetical protein